MGKRSRLDIRKYFFSQRVVQQWNSLPQHVIEAQSVTAFKRHFDKNEDMGARGNAY